MKNLVGNLNTNVVAKNQDNFHNKNPSDMESVLLQEFNFHTEPQVQMVSNNIIQDNNFSKNNLSPLNNNSIMPNKNNNNIINTKDVQKVKDSLSNSLNSQMQNNEFLQSTLDSDKLLFDSLLEDVEKINKQLYSVSEKNKQLKDEILEYRRKINMERDNLVKATSKLYSQTNELISSKGIFKRYLIK